MLESNKDFKEYFNNKDLSDFKVNGHHVSKILLTNFEYFKSMFHFESNVKNKANEVLVETDLMDLIKVNYGFVIDLSSLSKEKLYNYYFLSDKYLNNEFKNIILNFLYDECLHFKYVELPSEIYDVLEKRAKEDYATSGKYKLHKYCVYDMKREYKKEKKDKKDIKDFFIGRSIGCLKYFNCLDPYDIILEHIEVNFTIDSPKVSYVLENKLIDVRESRDIQDWETD